MNKGNGIFKNKQQIIDLFDNNPNITLRDIARKSGLTVPEIKQILMESNPR